MVWVSAAQILINEELLFVKLNWFLFKSSPLCRYPDVYWFCPWLICCVRVKLLRWIVEWWTLLQLSTWHLYLLLHCPFRCPESQLGQKRSCRTVCCLSNTFSLKNSWHFPKLWFYEQSGQFFLAVILCSDFPRACVLSWKEFLFWVRGMSSHASAYLSIQSLKWITFGLTSFLWMTFLFHFIIIAGDSFSSASLRTADDCRPGVNSWNNKVCTNCLRKAANEMKLSELSVEGFGQRSSLPGYAAKTICGLPKLLLSWVIASW